jgi:hypothetical protein
MKKSRVLLLAALAAAATINVSCSDKDEVLESGSKAKSNALIVNASLNEDSRIAPVTSSGFSSFMLYGYSNPTTDPTSVFDVTGDGIGFKNTSGTWGLVDVDLASKAVWPSSDVTCNFYALSVQGSHDLDATNTGLGLSNIKNGIFTYSMPTNNDGTVNLAAQKDILVACNNGATKGESGVLTLPFKHALAKVTLNLRFNETEYVLNSDGSLKFSSPQATASAMGGGKKSVAYIEYIAIHNVKCSGSYDFKVANGTWTVDAENSTIKYTFSEPKKFIAGAATTEDKDNQIYWRTQPLLGGEDSGTDNTIMMLPQTITPWVPTAENASATSKSYIEIHCLAYVLTTDDTYNNSVTFIEDQEDEDNGQKYNVLIADDNTLGASSVYIPLKVTAFEANKNYILNLNLVTSKTNTGGKGISSVLIEAN